MTSVALRARGLLALTCKSARQCAAGIPGKAPENYGNGDALKYLKQAPVCLRTCVA